MKAVFINRYGGTEVLEYGEQPTPVAKGRQVLVRVHASAVNPRDWLLREGRYQFRFLIPGFPKILGSDVSGVVVACGPRARRFQPDDAVFGMQTHLGRMGAYAEFIAIHENALALKPPNVSHIDAAAVPCAGMTAYECFTSLGHIQPHSRVTVIGASGGVGTYAIQIAKAMGAEVTGITSSRNVQLVRSLRADRVIDYETQDFTQLLHSQDIVFDTIGRQSLQTCSPIMRRRGRYITTIPALKTIRQSISSRVSRSLHMGDAPSSHVISVHADGRQLEQIARLMEHGQVRSVIDHVYPLAEVRQAHERSRTWRTCGKLVLQVRSA